MVSEVHSAISESLVSGKEILGKVGVSEKTSKGNGGRQGLYTDVPDNFVLPEGNYKRGAKLFKKHCSQCHSMLPDGRQNSGSTSVGPTLWNVYCRSSGVEEGGSNIVRNKGMGDAGIVWDDSNLMRYMKNPKLFVPESLGMNFYGISDFKTRVDIVHFLKTLTYTDPRGQDLLKKYNISPNI